MAKSDLCSFIHLWLEQFTVVIARTIGVQNEDLFETRDGSTGSP